MKQYAASTGYVGLHFNAYDDFIYSPVLKKEVIEAEPVNDGHVTVYLSHYSDDVVLQALQQVRDIRFEVFSKKVKQPVRYSNVTLLPISNEGFTKSMIHSLGVIIGAGFETPAEALYLGKKLLVLPIRGQYEQLCNAAALQDFKVVVIDKIMGSFANEVRQWLETQEVIPLHLSHSTYEIVQVAVERARSLRKNNETIQSLLTEEDMLALF